MAANITGDSPQAVAFALLEQIARAEGWDPTQTAYPDSRGPWKKTRVEILAAYKECLAVTLGGPTP
jgi:hypothetical protein